MDGDPTAIRSIAVSGDDVVMALEASLRDEADVVLRITPAFSGRMRARIHVANEDGPVSGSAHDVTSRGDADRAGPTPDQVVVPPVDLVSEVPPFPHPDATEDALRADPGVEYTPERHHEHHLTAVEEWRETVRESIVDEVTLSYGSTEHEVAVKVLG
jgi:hypothetical protein